MDLNHAVDLLSCLGHLELYQEYGFTHLNVVTSSHTYLAFGLASICHLDARLGFLSSTLWLQDRGRRWFLSKNLVSDQYIRGNPSKLGVPLLQRRGNSCAPHLISTLIGSASFSRFPSEPRETAWALSNQLPTSATLIFKCSPALAPATKMTKRH